MSSGPRYWNLIKAYGMLDYCKVGRAAVAMHHGSTVCRTEGHRTEDELIRRKDALARGEGELIRSEDGCVDKEGG